MSKPLLWCVRNSRYGVLGGAMVLSVLALLFHTPPHVNAATGINQQMNYQGRLLNNLGAVVPDGNYNIRFRIYQDGAGTSAGDPGGTLMWTEMWQNSSSQGI